MGFPTIKLCGSLCSLPLWIARSDVDAQCCGSLSSTLSLLPLGWQRQEGSPHSLNSYSTFWVISVLFYACSDGWWGFGSLSWEDSLTTWNGCWNLLTHFHGCFPLWFCREHWSSLWWLWLQMRRVIAYWSLRFMFQWRFQIYYPFSFLPLLLNSYTTLKEWPRFVFSQICKITQTIRLKTELVDFTWANQ